MQLSEPQKDIVLSPYFVIQIPNKQPRFILNLKYINSCVSAPHFKMEDYRSVLKLLAKNAFMCTLDLKNAYYTIPIYKRHRKYLCFKFDNKIYQFNCLLFSLCRAPFTFTKICKPISSWFRSQGITCTLYLDNFLIIVRDYYQCLKKTQLGRQILEKLSLIVNLEKSIIETSLEVESKYLAFIFNTADMTISLAMEKREKISLSSRDMLLHLNSSISIRSFAKYIGLLVSACPEMKYAWLYTKNLESCKMLALKKFNNNFNAKFILLRFIQDDLNWWATNVFTASSNITQDKLEIEIFTDASLTGWCAVRGDLSTKSWWSKQERKNHINFLELLAVSLSLKLHTLSSQSTLIRTDNTSVVAYINKMKISTFILRSIV